MPDIALRLRARRPAFLLLTLAAGSLAAACGSSSTPAAPPVTADTWAVVNGKAIVEADVNKAFQRTQDPAQGLSSEETMTTKLNLLNDLILQELLLSKAGALKVEVPQSELDAAFENGKKNIPEEAFQQELTRRNITVADMREGLRRELLAQKVVAQEVASKITVSDAEITDFFNANKARFNVPEEAYHLAQIVVTPARDPQISNATGDDAATPDEALKKAQMLMDRLKAGASFSELAVGYSEDPESAPRGGDLGLVPVTRLRQAPPQLRNAVLDKPVGAVNVASNGGAHTLVLVVSHETPGQRELTTPGVREQITEGLRARKEQLLRAAYLTAVRSEATVTNHIARRIVDANSTPAPGAAPLATPPATPAAK